MRKVIVAGGGIIGLSSALELARHGFQVRVLEKGRAMSEASWAAAGMLSPDDPGHPPALAKLAELSIRLYPEYLSTVEGLSGRSVRLRTRAAISTDEENGASVALSTEEAERRIPGLATWKGQIFTVQMRCPTDLAYVLRSPEVYLVPRGGGKIVVGATVEQDGFDRRVDPWTIQRLQGSGGAALAPDRFGPGGGKLDRASAGYQGRAAGNRERRTPALLGGDRALS